MTVSLYAEIEKQIHDLLTETSFEHCRRTAVVAAELARVYNEDVFVAELGGLAHDVARDMSAEELLIQARSLGHDVHPIETARPYLLHSLVGAGILTEKTGLDDPRIIRAVKCHTFGAPGMTNLDKVVYLADMIEPHRQFAGVDELRALAAQDLDAAFIAGFKLQLTSLINANKFLHPRTLDVWNVIVKEVRRRV
jgi:predicted HD superfamily hydrolase involved in NAD metabolism